VDFLNNDTSPAAEAVLIDLYRRMSSVEKARRLSEACRAVDHLARARIRHQCGEISDAEMRLRLGATRIPRELMVRVYKRLPALNPS
jgi:hypothetical protein